MLLIAMVSKPMRFLSSSKIPLQKIICFIPAGIFSAVYSIGRMLIASMAGHE